MAEVRSLLAGAIGFAFLCGGIIRHAPEVTYLGLGILVLDALWDIGAHLGRMARADEGGE